jgi:hypothetical protein
MKPTYLLHFLLSLIAILLLGIFIQNQYLISHLSHNQDTSSQKIPFQKANFSPSSQFALVPVNEDGSINVVIKGSTNVMQVDISKISTTNELEVDIREVNNRSVYDKIPVEMK